MFTISKQFAFSAAHRLLDLAPGHKCGRLHGHNGRSDTKAEAFADPKVRLALSGDGTNEPKYIRPKAFGDER